MDTCNILFSPSAKVISIEIVEVMESSIYYKVMYCDYCRNYIPVIDYIMPQQ